MICIDNTHIKCNNWIRTNNDIILPLNAGQFLIKSRESHNFLINAT